MIFDGFSLDFDEFPMDFDDRFQWYSMVFILIDFDEFYWILIDFQWFLMNFDSNGF